MSEKQWSRLILITAVLISAFFRFWQLDTLPPGLYHDEAYNGLDALSLTQGKTFPIFYEGWELYAQDAHANRPPNETRTPIFFEGNYGREPLHVYLMALSIQLLGATPFAIRAVPAASGVLAVLTTYFAASMLVFRQGDREIEGHGDTATRRHGDSPPRPSSLAYAPAFAALAIAILYPAVHFSRFGIRAMVFVPIETLAVGFFWLGLRRLEYSKPQLPITNYLPFLASGFLLGLGIYTYAAARLFPLLFILFIPLWLWHSKRWQTYWRYAAVMAVTSILTALPLLIFFFRYPYFFIFRIAFVSNKGTGTVDGRPLATWVLNIGRVVRGLIWRGETHLRHNLPGRPYLDAIQLALFTIGSGTYFYRWNRLRPIFLGLWLGVMLLPTIMSGDAPHFGRMTGSAPVVAILIGIGAAKIIDWGSGKRSVGGGRWVKIVLYSSLITLYCLSAWFTYRDYFIRYANHPQVAEDFYLPDWQLGQFAAAQGEETAVYLTPTQEEMATIYFALGDPDRIRSYAGGQGLVPLGQPNDPVVYLIRPFADNAHLAQIEQLAQPDALEEVGGVWLVNGRYNLDSFPDYTRSLHQWEDKIQLQAWQLDQSASQLSVRLLWQANSEMERPYTAFVHLLSETGELVAQLDRPPAGYPTTDWLPGEWIHDIYDVPLPPDLPEGAYRIQTGFYYLPTLEPMGEPVVLQELNLP